MSKRAVLLQEIETLPAVCIDEVVDFIGYLKEKKIKENRSLEQAAEMAADEYRNNKELTAFCVLDGEDFYESR